MKNFHWSSKNGVLGSDHVKVGSGSLSASISSHSLPQWLTAGGGGCSNSKHLQCPSVEVDRLMFSLWMMGGAYSHMVLSLAVAVTMLKRPWKFVTSVHVLFILSVAVFCFCVPTAGETSSPSFALNHRESLDILIISLEDSNVDEWILVKVIRLRLHVRHTTTNLND